MKERAKALEAAKAERQRLLAQLEPDEPAREPVYDSTLDPISPDFDPRSWDRP
jgi:hypothetical protein